MKLIYEPRFEIRDDVSALAESRKELNVLFSTLLGQYYYKHACISTETGRLIEESASGLIERCRKMQDVPPLEQMVVQDVMENAQKALAINNYFFKPDQIRLAQFLASVCGKGAYSTITSAIMPNKINHKAIHDFFYRMNQIEAGSIDPEVMFESDNFRDAKALMLQLVNEYKHTIEGSLKQMGVLSKLPTHDMVSSPYDFSFCDSDSSTIAIERALIPMVRKKGKYLVTKSLGMLTAGHELVHLVNDHISKTYVPFVSTDARTYIPQIHGVGVEGVAIFSEDLFLDWMAKNQKKLGIEQEIDVVRSFVASYMDLKMPETVFSILRTKEFHEAMRTGIPEHFKIGSYQEMARLSEIPLFRRDVFLFGDNSLLTIIGDLSYFLGASRMKKIANAARRKFNFNHNHKGLLLQALMTGTWSSGEAQQRFVTEHFLPQAERDGVIQRKPNRK